VYADDTPPGKDGFAVIRLHPVQNAFNPAVIRQRTAGFPVYHEMLQL
jgi:hypothetical protein